MTQKHIREIVKKIEAIGGAVEVRYRKRHVQLAVTIEGKVGVVTVSASPSDHRSEKNTLREVRRIAER